MILKNKIYWIILILALSLKTYGQRKKFNYSGRVRSQIDNNILTKTDTLNPDNQNTGYALMDLGFNIAPNDVTDIKAAIRLNSPYGGFYGVGATVSFRELYIRGIIANKVKYQAGDFKYKMTNYTFYNNTEFSNINEATVFSLQRDEILYDKMMTGNKWWQQGANAETKLLFTKGIDEIKIRGFLSRNRPTNFVSSPEILQAGADINVIKNKYFTIGINYINLFTVPETANTDVGFSNSVLSSNFELKKEINDICIKLFGETGLSEMQYTNDLDAPNTVNDYFYDAAIGAEFKKIGLSSSIGFQNVGPEFISAGSQTMRVNYNANPLLFPNKVNTDSSRAVNISDLVSDASVYNVHISQNLSYIDHRFSNVLPYGKATPNRTGFNVNLAYHNKNNSIDADINYINLSEISTYGTTSKRMFSVIKVKTNIYVNKMFGFKRNVKLNLGFRNETTNRSGDSLQAIDLNSSIIDAGLDIELINKFYILSGIKILSANGNEIISNRNTYNEITDYTPIKYNETQNLYGFGLRYMFSDAIHLSAYAHILQLSDKGYDTNSIEINRLVILFSMQF